MGKKCVVCEQVNPRPLQKCCGFSCATAWLKSPKGIAAQDKLKVARAKRQATRERKKLKERKEGIRSKSEWLSLTQKEFNRFIRLRDYGLPCISCGTTADIQYAAGHYFSVGAAPELRFEPLNVHRQCNKKCNCELSANLLNYRIGLIERIGQDKVDWLEGAHAAKHYTILELKDLKVKFRKMANELTKELKERCIL